MRRVLRWTLGVLGAVSVLVAGIFVLMPKDRIQAAIVAEVRALTGFETRFEGPTSLTLSPTPGLALGRVTVIDPRAPGTAVLVADGAIVRPSIRALLGGEWAPGAIDLTDADLTLADVWTIGPVSLRLSSLKVDLRGGAGGVSIRATGTEGDDAYNLSADIRDPAALLAGRASHIALSGSLGDNGGEYTGAIAFEPGETIPALDGTGSLDLPTGLATASGWVGLSLPDVAAEIAQVEISTRMRTQASSLVVTARGAGVLRHTPVNIDLSLLGNDGWRRGAAIETTTTLRAGGTGSLYASGLWLAESGFTGETTLSVLDLPEALAWLDLPDPQIPGLGPTPRADGMLTVSQNRITVSDATLIGAELTYQGELTLDRSGQPPAITVHATVPVLDISAFAAPGAAADIMGRVAGLAEELGPIDLNMTTPAMQVSGRDLSAGGLRLGATNEAVEAAIALDAIYGGTLQARLVLVPGTGQIALSGQMHDFSTRTAGLAALNGAATADVALTAPDDAASWLDANGTAGLSVFGGTLALPNLPDAASGREPTRQSTRFAVMTVPLVLSGGAAETDSLRIAGGDWEMAGRLSIGTDGAMTGRLAPMSPGAYTLTLGGSVESPAITLGDPVGDAPTENPALAPVAETETAAPAPPDAAAPLTGGEQSPEASLSQPPSPAESGTEEAPVSAGAPLSDVPIPLAPPR